MCLGCSQAVRQRVLIPSCVGSNPAIPAINICSYSVYYSYMHVFFFLIVFKKFYWVFELFLIVCLFIVELFLDEIIWERVIMQNI